ncbi:MAG TPA: N-acetylmuramoyl-L-alanine amidase, partial [Hanamia sp.]|nr:N-acetylmuramoyl-L-alanine amidase [Hanamia sp.]
GSVIQMLQTISYGDEIVIEYSRKGFHINSQMLAATAYLLVCGILLTIFFIALYRIKKLKKKYPKTEIEGIHFINTNDKGTPFSFFNFIFWNKAIDLHSKPGQQIFNHEIAHIKEKHSYDKIFMNLVLIFFWINPFFWLMRKELYMIHEFIADQEALEDSDLNAFAEMILQTVYPGQNFSSTNPFFYSPLKRRFIMLTKNKNPKVSYLSRLLVLPLAALLFFAFTLKVKTANNDKMSYDGKTITVVVDAGHGGNDHGALSLNGLLEKDITLSIVKKIAALNSNDRIKILLSRDDDQSLSVKDRVEFAKNKRADMFISIHINAMANDETQDKNGFSVLIDKNNKNILLASALINELKKSYTTEDKVHARKNGIWVLDANTCPAAIIECGYLTNPGDEAFITNKTNQEKIARNILNAIENFAANLNNNDSQAAAAVDTIPEMYYNNKKVNSLELNQSKVKVTYDDGSKETITKAEAQKRGFVFPPPPPPPIPPVAPVPPVATEAPAPPPPPLPKDAVYVVDGKVVPIAFVKSIDPATIKSINVLKSEKASPQYGAQSKNGIVEINLKRDENIPVSLHLENNNSQLQPLYFIDGKEASSAEFKNISPNNIQSVNVIKGESAEKKYGTKGKNGVIEITTHPSRHLSADTIPGKVFTKTQVEASFPGGASAWTKYIIEKIQSNIDSLTEKDYGTCLLKFIVNKNGTVSDVKATTMQGTKLADTAVNTIQHGPNGIRQSKMDTK